MFIYNLFYWVTLPTERVSWNVAVFVPLARHYSHAPHGACELKLWGAKGDVKSDLVTLPTERVSWNFALLIVIALMSGHAPHGACELKFGRKIYYCGKSKSRSPRSVWVEIVHCFSYRLSALVTLPTERVSWNVKFNDGDFVNTLSRSPRSVWVEIFLSACYNANTESRSPRSVWVEIHQLQ